MQFCMDATTGDDRHEEVRYADYEVHRTESSVAAYWCADCLLEYIECGMGDCLQLVTRLRPNGQQQKVVEELKKLGVDLK